MLFIVPQDKAHAMLCIAAQDEADAMLRITSQDEAATGGPEEQILIPTSAARAARPEGRRFQFPLRRNSRQMDGSGTV
jgi:hypothetical protein